MLNTDWPRWITYNTFKTCRWFIIPHFMLVPRKWNVNVGCYSTNCSCNRPSGPRRFKNMFCLWKEAVYTLIAGYQRCFLHGHFIFNVSFINCLLKNKSCWADFFNIVWGNHCCNWGGITSYSPWILQTCKMKCHLDLNQLKSQQQYLMCSFYRVTVKPFPSSEAPGED